MGKDGDPGQARRGPHSNPENWYGGGGTRGKEGGDGDTPGRRARERQGQKRETGGQRDREKQRQGLGENRQADYETYWDGVKERDRER